MYQHPELMLTLAHDHQRELIADADRKRLFNQVNRRRGDRLRSARTTR
ncbi:hypothetical protein Ais01nite_66560 [Asanoa ishikariensis]|uniref:Uncharacterized protein n=1 Tax=Asanoa ishikariensis TaxID=137265 RepID=A0A1H3NIC1_9ACTN|nr:hypothetical protein [Asanoa ishikariensis]GIF68621.1 hypothetical protein Ais01nite_66560 [Asanoa ishikariensis]SDY88185.1 hypothetical protein SAMN05421684_2070 [Asanoa ishikariensis]